MRSRVFEFRETELVLTTGFIPIPIRIPYLQIVSVERTSYLGLFGEPVICLSLGISWKCALIKTGKGGYGVMLNSCDQFVSELKTRVERAKRDNACEKELPRVSHLPPV